MAGGLLPWRAVVAPRPEVLRGEPLGPLGAADLGGVWADGGAGGPPAARAFLARTWLTPGLLRLLAAAVRRLAGAGGASVVQLQAGFGGGKTHALLALYHLGAGGTGAAGMPTPGDGPEAAEAAGAWRRVAEAAGVSALPRIAVGLLVGSELSAARPWASPALGGRSVRTLWGELAAQLGGEAAYRELEAEDAQGVPPGAAALGALLDRHGPCLILLDELVPYLRPLAGRPALSGGSFDAQLTFVHNLSEAVRRTRNSLLALTLPASEAEWGGEGGRRAAAALAATLGRLQQGPWQPVGDADAVLLARQRLLGPVRDEAARAATCDAFARMYGEGLAGFPDPCRGPGYRELLLAAYPLHPGLGEVLARSWGALPGFQGTRGLLRVVAAALRALWARDDPAPLVLAGRLPLDDPALRSEVLGCLEPAWATVLNTDVDGPGARSVALEATDPRWGARRLPRRIARALFLQSAPQGAGASPATVRLLSQEPDDGAAWDDALVALTEHLSHLHAAGGLLRLDPAPGLQHEAATRAAALPEQQVSVELERRLRAQIARAAAGRDSDGMSLLAGVHLIPEARRGAAPAAMPPDDELLRLAVLSPALPHHPAGDGTSPALACATELLRARVRHPNTLLFLAADADGAAAAAAAARRLLGWVALRQELGRRPRSAQDARRLRTALGEGEQRLTRRLEAAYGWLLTPLDGEGGAPAWDVVRLSGEGDPVERAVRRLVADGVVHADWSPAELRLQLERWFWRGQPHAALDTVWRAMTRYLYLPRLAGMGVLLRAVTEGVAQGLFAYADGVGPDGHYLGLRTGPGEWCPRLDGLLLRPEVASADPAGRPWTPGAAPAPGAPPTPRAQAGETAVGVRVTLPLDPRALGREAARAAASLVEPLRSLAGVETNVSLQLDIRAAPEVRPAVWRVVEAGLGGDLGAGARPAPPGGSAPAAAATRGAAGEDAPPGSAAGAGLPLRPSPSCCR